MTAKAVGQCIRPWQLTPAPRARIVCLPHAGGSASYFRVWQNALPADIDLLAVQYPGREDRFHESPKRTLGHLADDIALELVRYADRPLVLFGHSLGAALAYEVAIRLEERRIIPQRVFASAHPPPHLQRLSNLHRQSDEALLNDIRRLSGKQASLLDDPELRGIFLPMVRNDYQLIETYRQLNPCPLSAPIVVVMPTNDNEVTRNEAEAWQRATKQPLRVLAINGGHFYLAHRYPLLIELMVQSLDGQAVSRKKQEPA